jgi:hypothetical protein
VARVFRTLEVADIVRAHGEAFRQAHAGSLSVGQKRVLLAIERCRTAARWVAIWIAAIIGAMNATHITGVPAALSQVPVLSQSQMIREEAGGTARL